MHPIAFGEPLLAGTRLTLFSDDKPDRFFTVIKFWMDETMGLPLPSEPAFLPIKSKTACRAEGLPEAGGRQNSFTASTANRGGKWRPLVPLAARLG